MKLLKQEEKRQLSQALDMMFDKILIMDETADKCLNEFRQNFINEVLFIDKLDLNTFNQKTDQIVGGIIIQAEFAPILTSVLRNIGETMKELAKSCVH